MRCTRLYAVVVLGISIVIAAGCGKKPPELAPPEPPTVAVVHPRIVPQQAIKEFTGRLVTKDAVKVIPQVTGRLLAREFKDGTYVEKGKTVLYRIDPVLFQADVDKAKADIAKAKADMANWSAQIDRDKAEYIRQKEQIDKGAGSKTDYDKALATVKVSESQLDVAKAAKASGESALTQATENLKYCTIFAPTSGLIGRSLVAPDAMVNAYQSELVTVFPINEIYCEFEVDEQASLWYRSQIQAGLFGDPRHPDSRVKATIKLKNEKEFSTNPADRSRNSEVDVLDPEIARQTGTRTLRATFINVERKGPDGKVLPPLLSAGDSVRVRLFAGAPRPTLTVPETVVFSQQQKQYVYVVMDGKAQLREVEPQPAIDGLVEVNRRTSATATTGLDESDTVIADNLLRVRPGIPVTVK